MSCKKKSSTGAEITAIVLGTIAAFVLGRHTVLMERGYTAYGGEYFMLLFPYLYYMGRRTFSEWAVEFRAVWGGGSL